MAEDKFETELDNLLREEAAKKEKLLPYPESIEAERQVLRTAFENHYVALTLLRSEEFTPEAIIYGSRDLIEDEVMEFEEELAIKMWEVIDTLPNIVGAEFLVSGYGVYYAQEKDDKDEKDEGGEVVAYVLSGEKTISGDVIGYRVIPALTQEIAEGVVQNKYEDSLAVQYDMRNHESTLHVVLENAVIKTQYGEEHYEKVLIPFLYESFIFHRMTYSPLAPKTPESAAEYAITEFFKSHLFGEICTSLENNLNYNNYTGAEFQAMYESSIEELFQIMENLMDDSIISLHAEEGHCLDGQTVTVGIRESIYTGPTIQRIADEWRVVHGFDLLSEDGTCASVHITPQNIQQVTRKN